MQKIPGVAIQVGLDGDSCQVNTDGSVSELDMVQAMEGSAFTLTLTVDRKADVMVAKVGKPHSKEKTVQVWTPRTGDAATVSYDLSVEVKNSPTYGCLVTHYPGNYLAVVVLDRKGNFDFWEVAIVSQLGAFFVTTQKKYTARLYAYRGTAVVPQFANWPELQAALAERHSVKKYDLAPQAEYKPAAKPASAKLGLGDNEVLWWDAAKGLGCLRTDSGDTAMVTLEDIQPRPRLRYLVPGERVMCRKFEQLPPGSGSFKFAARGVMPLNK